MLATSLAALAANFKRDLMMLQLNSYRNERYARWFNQSQESTNVMRILACIALFMMFVPQLPYIGTSVLATIIMVWTFVALTRRKYKKPLVWTNRAKRIYLTMWILAAAIMSAIIAFTLVQGQDALLGAIATGAVVCLGLNVVSPLLLLASNWLLKPVEKHINNKYVNDAARILASMPDLKIIGITGSYGKTSTKHYLNRILSEKFDTLMTPGSFNTPMGVVRTVREYLKPYNEVFIVEMGAKQVGDIKEICDLVHPEMGVVTAVGEQHLESFKSIENIQKTKFELIDALPAGGFGVVNDDFPFIANREVKNVDCVRYAVRNTANADYKATDITMDHTGTTFTIEGHGRSLTLHTRLVGECNISNLMAAAVIAMKLGVEDEKIQYAVDRVEQVEHRLNMKRTPGGITIIDDAFNSNPTGSHMALDVLAAMPGGKRILVTPGMIELGDRQFELNKEFGDYAASRCDVAIVVNQYNREAIVAGLKAGGMDENDIHAVDSFAEAQNLLSGIMTAGDTVLYENDLPDTFK